MSEKNGGLRAIHIVFIVPYPQLEYPIKSMIREYLSENQIQPVNIFYIVPCAQQEFFAEMPLYGQQYAQDEAHTLRVFVDPQKPVDLVLIPYIEQLDFEYDAIIARGNLAERIKNKHPAIPIIDMPFTGYDVIYALLECIKKYHPMKIAVIGKNRVVSQAKGLAEALRCQLNVYEVDEPSQVDSKVLQAMSEGCDAVIGGYTTVACARHYGLQVVVFPTGPEAIRMSLTEALRLTRLVREEREHSETYRIMTQSSQDGMIYVNADKIISVINPAAQQMYFGPHKIFQEKPLAELFAYMVPGVNKVLSNGTEIFNELCTVGEITLSVNYLPVLVLEAVVGVVIHFQNVTKIQDTESQVRQKLSHKGLNAKYHLEDVLHKSEIMKGVLNKARRYAQVSSNILIVGETGTGKELIAQGIHNLSTRQHGPFVAVNCAALTENLLESELFGYSDGAFTGANKGGKMGLFELAHNGTIFLDEISEIPINFQSKLLRVLQEGEVRRIGDSKVIPINVRVIAATNRNLQRMADKGEFRQDLLYRINILRLYVPPINQREEDIQILFENFLNSYAKKYSKRPLLLSSQAVEILQKYNFKGNVRELRNLAERICVLCDEGIIGKEEINEALFPQDVEENDMRTDGKLALDAPEIWNHLVGQFQRAQIEMQQDLLERMGCDIRYTQDQVETELIVQTMKKCGNNQSKAAKMLGVDRSTLWRKIKKYGI